MKLKRKIIWIVRFFVNDFFKYGNWKWKLAGRWDSFKYDLNYIWKY